MLRFMSNIPIFTIGYGARSLEELIAVLREKRVAFLIDVRSQPYSRYKPEYGKEALQARLKEEGIRYVFMGDQLGGRPADPACYTAGGKVDYKKVARTPGYIEGIGRLREARTQGLSVVLMCSEGKPENCHRSKLIGATLEAEGIAVAHIDEHDQTLTQEDVRLRVIGGQPSLFGPDFHQLTSRKRYDGDRGSGAGDLADDGVPGPDGD